MSNVIPFPARSKSPASELEQRVAEIAESLADWDPPTRESIYNPYLVSVRMAHNVVTGTPAQLRKFVTETDRRVLDEFMQGLSDSAEFFDGLADLCGLAGQRILADAMEADVGEA